MTPGLAAEIAALNAELDAAHSPWHAFVSRGSDPRSGLPASRGGRVWAGRCLPVHPRAEARGLAEVFTPCGETLDADTPGQMRALLTARAAS